MPLWQFSLPSLEAIQGDLCNSWDGRQKQDHTFELSELENGHCQE